MNAKEIKKALGINFKPLPETGIKRDDEIIRNANRFFDATKKATDRNLKYENFRIYVNALNTLRGKAVDDFDLDDAMYDLFNMGHNAIDRPA